MLAEAGLRIETDGPVLPARGRGYAAGAAGCMDAEPGRAAEKRYHSAAIGVVDTGAFGYITAGGEAVAVPGAILLGNAGESFACRHFGPEGNTRSVLAISAGLMAEAIEALGGEGEGFGAAILPPAPAFARFHGAIRRLAGSGEELEDAALELVTDALRASRGRADAASPVSAAPDVRVLKIIRLLHEHPDPAPTLSELAELARLSRYHFIRSFRRMTGASPGQYLIALRLRTASEALRDTKAPVTEIALNSGFNDLSHFNRMFRRAYAMPPSRWRALN